MRSGPWTRRSRHGLGGSLPSRTGCAFALSALLLVGAGTPVRAQTTQINATDTSTIDTPAADTAANTTGATAPAPSSGASETHRSNGDPLEGVNRYFFSLDLTLDDALLKPTAYAYRYIVPKPGRLGIRNVLHNLDSPVIFANDILQGEWSRAGTTTARFGINSTLGLLGLFDVAKSIGLRRHDEDFGQTLAVNGGVGGGPYLVLPFLGPTNFRDLTGRVVDIAFDPMTWMGGSDVQTIAITRFILEAISDREANIETFDEIERSSIDLYSQVRSIYNQRREHEIKNGRDDLKDIPDLSNLDAQ